MSAPAQTIEGFLLTRGWRDTPRGLELSFWISSEHGPCRIRLGGQRAVCFVDRDAPLPAGVNCERRALDLCSMAGVPVDGLYFQSQRALQGAVAASAGAASQHEADIKRGLIAFNAPIARAMIGKEVGDTAVVKTPKGKRELEISDVEFKAVDIQFKTPE